MSIYKDLRGRIDGGEVIILDGAVGTQLQELGVPLGATAWAGIALHSHPDTVRFMHESYIKAGVDIITTNTYSSARHCFEPLGMGDVTRELNIRAVRLAKEARDRVAKDRPVYIAGSVSNFGCRVGDNAGSRVARHGWSAYTEEQCQANLHEQAEILAEAGVDFFVTESTGSTMKRKWVVEACLATGVPTWIGFKSHYHEETDALNISYDYENPERFDTGVDEVLALGGDLVTIFHTIVETVDKSLPVIKEKWSGPIGVYPDADRHDYVQARSDPNFENRTSPNEFLELARAWVGGGVQVVGGCCGFGLEYIKPLRDGLPSHIPTPGARTGTDG